MSINFKQNNELSTNTIISLKNDNKDDKNIKIKTIYNHFVKIFDNHFLNFIANRKQRDLMITNIFYRMILEDIKIDKDINKIYQLSNNFSLKNKKLKINEEEILPISNREMVLNLNHEIIILKTFEMFFQEIKNVYRNINIQLIDKKIQKIIFLTDEKMLSKLTSNIDIQNKIIGQIGNIISYQNSTINAIFLNSLKKECEIFGIKI